LPVAQRRLPTGAGGTMAFALEGGGEAVQRMIKRFDLATFAASLGGVETTVSYPEITSHRSLSAEERADLGVGAGTVRVSVGIEDPADLVCRLLLEKKKKKNAGYAPTHDSDDVRCGTA